MSLRLEGVAFSYGTFRRRQVFENLTWQVAPGATTLLLGPNGAGKSTLLKLLSGYERPRRGLVSWDGEHSRSALFDNVGWMPQTILAARGLTVIEQIEYAGWVAGRSRSDSRAAAREAVEAVRLTELTTTRSTELSGGQLRRLGLAQALVRAAPVLLLDEPTAGLDPAQSLNFREVMRGVDCPGGVVVSTHQVADIAEDVDRIALLIDGAISFDGTVEEFRALGEPVGTDASLADVFAFLVKGGQH